MGRLPAVTCIAAVLIAAGCSKNPVEPMEFPFTSPSMVPETSVLDGLELDMECYLWRDFMPSTVPSDPKGMMASIRIFETSQRDLPGDLAPEYMWIFSEEGDVWGASIDREIMPGSNPWEMVTVARDGPFWETGIKTQVVVRLKRSGDHIYLRESGVTVIRTE